MQKKEKIYACAQDGCISKFNRPHRLAQHMLTHLKIKTFSCTWDNCFKSYSNKSHLKRHIASTHEHHSNNILHSCPQCLKNYSNRQNLKKHIKLKHENKLFLICDCCKVQFKKKHQLSAHMYIHNGVKSFSCEICEKNFVTLHEKKRHMRSHKIYNCDQCAMKFNQWSKYQKHKKSEHDNKQYICNECGKIYNQRSYIIRHMRIHSNTQHIRSFSCPYTNCFRRYSRNSNLTQHIITKHEDIKHSCTVCQAELSSKAKLNKHLKLHENGEQHKRHPKCLNTGRKERKDKGSMKVTTALKLAGLVSKVTKENCETK
ncbi:unnamed protein product [Parnassius mnemosyne]|uniref:C2H2-type domain-containing protein n=1 Tax=Parnassius mnemosyne TaxID=213953 RepID=A0AAV1KA59_9NEOP